MLREVSGPEGSVTAWIKYKVKFHSDWKIRFLYSVEASSPWFLENDNESFVLESHEDGLRLYLNGFRIVINE